MLFPNAKEPNRDKRHGLKRRDQLPNDPASERKKMLMALDDLPVKVIYEKLGVLYNPKIHTAKAIEEFVKQRFRGRKRSGPDRTMYKYEPRWKWETLRTGKPLGHRERIGIRIGLDNGITVERVAHWTFRTLEDAKRLMDQVRGYNRIRNNALLKDIFEEPNV